MTSTAVEVHRSQKLRTHQQALKTGRSAAQLLTVATQLKETCRRLQEERSQLLQQQHLLWSLAEVLSSYRASLQDDWDQSSAELEQVLLQQLTVQVPAMTSGSHWHSTDSSAASNDSISSATGSGQPSQQVDSDVSSVSSESSRDGSLDQSLGESSAAGWCSRMCTFSTLGLSSTGGCADTVTAAGSTQLMQQQADQPSCPAHDPFMLLREAMDQPLDPHTAHITLAGLCARWATDVQQLRKYLDQLETGTHASTDPAPAESSSHPSSRAGSGGADAGADSSVLVQTQPAFDPLQGIKDIQRGMFFTSWSLPFANKSHLFFELQLTDWHTGERLQEPCKQRHRAALRAMQLTPAQLQRIATGWELFQRLLQPLVRTRKQLHARGVHVPQQDQGGGCQQAGCALAADAAPLQQPSSCGPAVAERQGASVDGGGVSSSSGSVAGAGVFAGNSRHGARLQAQQEQVSEMRVLMRKDMLLRGAMAMHLQGCISWRQQAKLRVMMAPFQMNVGIFHVVLTEHIQQEHPQLLAGLQQQPTTRAAASSTMFGAAAAAAGAAAGAAAAAAAAAPSQPLG